MEGPARPLRSLRPDSPPARRDERPSTSAAGRVYLVGAGPGAVDLLTVRAVRLLGRADIVFHDALVDAEVLALAPQARLVAVGKRCGAHSTSQRFINKRLVDAAGRHAVVVRLKGGDPMLFGRAQEEIDALAAAGVDVEVVPGVTAALAAAADLKLSLTRRGVARSVAFVTPRTGEGEAPHAWARTAAAADTAAIYMGAGEAHEVVAALAAHGVPLDRPVMLVESASRPDVRTRRGALRDLPALAGDRGGGPALILLGEIGRAAGREAAVEPARSATA
ncbi:MAG TPA: uroporphyrinogen-III C-methyltransferase [Casimicrobiaceae bacterium]|nr:uroporphyrinogen-III C-methyltransferase [Casimicrobiaceae bacterium]